jgi:hypothetical protein
MFQSFEMLITIRKAKRFSYIQKLSKTRKRYAYFLNDVILRILEMSEVIHQNRISDAINIWSLVCYTHGEHGPSHAEQT